MALSAVEQVRYLVALMVLATLATAMITTATFYHVMHSLTFVKEVVYCICTAVSYNCLVLLWNESMKEIEKAITTGVCDAFRYKISCLAIINGLSLIVLGFVCY